MSLDERIRLIPHITSDNAAINLAIDSALLEKMQEKINGGESVKPILRTYQFRKPAVILGCHQKIEGRFDKDLAAKSKIDLTRRDSGGGHMYFGTEDFHFSFIAPSDYFGNKNLIERYQFVNGMIATALKDAGYNAELGRTSIRLDNPEGKIIAGTARRENGKVSLQQGGILIEDYDEKIFKLLMAREYEVRLWQDKVSALRRFNPNLFLDKLPRRSFYKKDLNYDELQRAQDLAKTKYANPAFISSGIREVGICLVAEYSKDDVESDMPRQIEGAAA